MASRKFRVAVKVDADTREASGAIDGFRGKIGRLSTSMKVTLVAAAVAAVAALRGLVSGMRSAVAASQVQEDAVRALDAALGNMVPNVDAVSARLQAHASALQKVSIFGDEAIIKQQALMASMGVTAELLPLATTAAVDLAAALGIDLESAARNIAKTVGGLAGELGELLPALKDLTAEELQAGEGIELLASVFEGRAAEGAKTFSGKLAQLKGVWGDLLEVVGDAVTKNDSIRNALEKLKNLVSDPAFVKSIGDMTDKFVTNAIEMGKTVGKVLSLGEAFTRLKDKLGDPKFVSDINSMTRYLKLVWTVVSGLTGGIYKLLNMRFGKPIGAFAEWATRADEVALSQSAVAATAARMGMAIGDVERHIAHVKDTADVGVTSMKVFGEKMAEADSKSTGLGLALSNDVIPAVDQLPEKMQAAADATDQYDGAADRTVNANDRLGQSFDRVTQKAQQAAVVVAGVAGGTLVNAPSSAMGPGLTTSGRVRLPGGGSRLLRPIGESLFPNLGGGGGSFGGVSRSRSVGIG